MFSEQELGGIVQQITQNYKNEELFYIKNGCCMPGRDCIIHIILKLRQIMFPGYFDDEYLGRTVPEYFVGHNILQIYDDLLYQVKSAFIQVSEEDVTEKEITAKCEKICMEFFSSLGNIQNILLKDVEAAYNGDPAAKTKQEIIFCYPGLLAIFVYRIAHELYKMGVPLIPRIMSEYAHSRTGIDINPGASIGEYFFIDHGTGVVIGETTIIGNNVKIYQGVTLGALSTRSGQLLRDIKRHPTIEDNVTIYSSASILGGETVIGRGSVIGGNAFITESVPPGTRVSVKNPEHTFTDKSASLSINELFD
ncbi:MAG: serine acetyltransferase [Lachnospiraceae bacterium]|nr:serine acetyltransferase [Lachnospiraceae bacterium]